ncbi:MAG: hypothetical protein A3I44_00410 [Candidatus Sungbacteria bacterium RIFCSPLOWO2_02_FULL_51_17]|uniref:Uncharacterized protein n=1 Tax=Candidatus Sungbacteria bacterium RIFCSPHIGHO2_02_FULL_51_29 TaxID=1802273 RepID=A0A1G2KPF1_9BACT|nr:MAG: hypothetical protein A2676_04790 [Candidatus Sungbacteria bacterium RIFCSPHIGHO2_01_FULL_51_22]OHA01277.1 MAG: hypothetical protein A3C16_01910 [Candidatus Sungbacteria bacterium RIFCSPHIGHO2_02_FULL_51_29]OHA07779.1 MAG: hypothetical protein A3B29_00640 [Candidatus Sungbacteria bacterium RIFCSPLOWO2_01_FULL_51_34]OHA12556.1 MAG: hypothetical protein A3I44_00410 [Candidatus Sungbacteria bacterium RIFCSPLOWO2_02_FULL_51_17]
MKKVIVAFFVALLLSGMVSSASLAEYLPTDAQISQAMTLIPVLGRAHETSVAYQVGESYREGAIAFFGVTFGGTEKVYWGYEEWEPMGVGADGDKLFLVTWWEFTRTEVRRRVNIYAYSGKMHGISELESVPMTPEIATKSEKAWRLLSKAGTSI